MGSFAVESKSQTCGAAAQSPIATDRPQVTHASVVVPCGSLQFENGLQVADQLGVTWPTESGLRNVTGQTSLYFDRQLTSPWVAYVKYSSAFRQRGGPQHLIDFVTAYKPAPHQQLDLHCGFGLSSAAPDYSIGFGYSVRFQVIRAK